MTHPPHSVKVETQVVERVQDLCEHFIRSIKMAQIRSGVTIAHAAAAIRVERTGILRIARLLDGNFSFRSKQQAVARRAGGENAIHHIDAQASIFGDLLRRPDSHEVPWLIGGQVFESGFDHFAGALARLANA